MEHRDHVGLIRDAVAPGGTWLELGSGAGAFTLALAELLGPGGTIHSVDTDRAALRAQADAVRSRYPAVRLEQRAADFTSPLGYVAMDGVLMANALHFATDKAAVLTHVRSYLAPRGKFVLVEYDADQGNRWVPHPISWASWATFAPANGFSRPRLLGRASSRFLGGFYAAESTL